MGVAAGPTQHLPLKPLRWGDPIPKNVPKKSASPTQPVSAASFLSLLTQPCSPRTRQSTAEELSSLSLPKHLLMAKRDVHAATAPRSCQPPQDICTGVFQPSRTRGATKLCRAAMPPGREAAVFYASLFGKGRSIWAAGDRCPEMGGIKSDTHSPAGTGQGARGDAVAIPKQKEPGGGAQIPKRSELGGTNPKPGGTNPPRGSSPGPPLSRHPPGPQLSPQPPRAASPRSTRRGAGRGRPAAGRRRRG